MNDTNKIIETLKVHLQQLDSVHAMWLEGSYAEGDNDSYSDLDIWLSVDDDKLRIIYDEVEKALETIAPIDFKLIVKPTGELGHNVYHLRGMSEFLSLDINTQKLSRDIRLTEGIDIYKTIFDKNEIIQTSQRKPFDFDKEHEISELLKFIDYAFLSVKKNTLRGKKLEAQEYYRNILVHILEFLRKQAGISEKVDFGFKHVYKDIPRNQAEKLEGFYFAEPNDETIDSLKSWLRSI